MVDEPAHVWAWAMPLQYQEAALSIHCIERLLQVDGDSVEGGLLNVGKLLRQLCLNYRSTRPPPVAASVKAVV
jgi:hypothetical protein